MYEWSELPRYCVALSHTALSSGHLHTELPIDFTDTEGRNHLLGIVITFQQQTGSLPRWRWLNMTNRWVLKGTDSGDRLNIAITCHPPTGCVIFNTWANPCVLVHHIRNREKPLYMMGYDAIGFNSWQTLRTASTTEGFLQSVPRVSIGFTLFQPFWDKQAGRWGTKSKHKRKCHQMSKLSCSCAQIFPPTHTPPKITALPSSACPRKTQRHLYFLWKRG